MAINEFAITPINLNFAHIAVKSTIRNVCGIYERHSLFMLSHTAHTIIRGTDKRKFVVMTLLQTIKEEMQMKRQITKLNGIKERKKLNFIKTYGYLE